MEDNNRLIRKFIPLLAVTGSLCGFFLMLYRIAYIQVNMLNQTLIFIGYLIAGTFFSYIANKMAKKAGKDIIYKNVRNEPFLVKQHIYLAALPVMVISYIASSGISLGFAFVFALANSTAFLFGLANGIFDYKETVTQKLLYAGVVPIGLSFVYAYYGANEASVINAAWIFGSLYLFAYLLLINRMKLNSILFFRNSVNVENSKKIRIQNDILIGLFYILYLIFFNFRDVIEFSYGILAKAFTYILIAMQAIMDFLLVQVEGTQPAESQEIFEEIGQEVVKDNWFTYVLYGLLIIALVTGVVFGLIFLVKFLIKLYKAIVSKLSGATSKSAKKEKVVALEYEEESEIIHHKKRFSVTSAAKKKFKYTLKGLSQLKNNSERIRYMYGFVIERLKFKNVEIKKSDDPEEILSKVAMYDGGAALTEKGFVEFSGEYSKVRYGNKEPHFVADENQAKKFEKDINNIKAEKKEKVH